MMSNQQSVLARSDVEVEDASVSSPARQVLFKLEGLFDPAESLRWLGTRQARLGGSPMELVERGQADRVLQLLIRLEEGTHI
jgi:hypothetical protein